MITVLKLTARGQHYKPGLVNILLFIILLDISDAVRQRSSKKFEI